MTADDRALRVDEAWRSGRHSGCRWARTMTCAPRLLGLGRRGVAIGHRHVGHPQRRRVGHRRAHQPAAHRAVLLQDVVGAHRAHVHAVVRVAEDASRRRPAPSLVGRHQLVPVPVADGRLHVVGAVVLGVVSRSRRPRRWGRPAWRRGRRRGSPRAASATWRRRPAPPCARRRHRPPTGTTSTGRAHPAGAVRKPPMPSLPFMING